MANGVTATTAYTDDFNDSVLLDIIDEFKHFPYSFVLFSALVPGCLFEIVFSRYLRVLPTRFRQK
ncbi:MAG: hypothetical protein FH752_15410 [Marinobacter adhaerens]|jgi:hypothetical protein|uniref:Uncharacterized protein n=2 Tax=Marinobacter TaxID=2742 RepID=A0A844I4R9_9GAMM|nr:hypothetical protein [Marinobacter adhaerens]GBO85352.1 hypothetical protein MS5N3_28030 [Marinobacter salsuginis]